MSMRVYTRRELAGLTFAALTPANASPPKPNSKINGVVIGAQSYSFRDRSLDEAIQGMVDAGLSHCVLWQGHVEPRLGQGEDARRELRKWRTSVPMAEFAKIRDKFQRAGIRIHAYYYSFRADFSDEEMARGFEMARALGVKCLEASATVSQAKRIDTFASKAKMYVGVHNHSNLTPDEFARPEDFEEALRGTTHIRINFDIGHFVVAGFDPVGYLEKHHKKVIVLDIKDRDRDGVNHPFGKGATPIREVLQLMQRRKYNIPAMIEYEYKGTDTVAEVKRCYDYCRAVLAPAR